MQKIQLEKQKEEFKKMWKNLQNDYKIEDLPVVKLSYAHILTRPLFYPVNKFSYGLALLMRRKTFTKTEIEHLRQMGFVVEIEVRQLELPEGCS